MLQKIALEGVRLATSRERAIPDLGRVLVMLVEYLREPMARKVFNL